MTIDSIASRRKGIAFVTAMSLCVVIVAFSLYRIAKETSQYDLDVLTKEIVAYERDIEKYKSEIEANTPLKAEVARYSYSTDALRKRFNDTIAQTLKNIVKREYGFIPFEIEVQKVDFSPKYLNLVHVTLRYKKVDWIFGFKDGFEAANSMLHPFLQKYITFATLYKDLRKVDNATVIAYFKLPPKQR